MRRGGASSGSDFEVFPIIPILVFYGGEEVEEDLGWTKYCCPFHGDTTPSASVNTTEQFFNCHVYAECPKGTATQIIMHKEGLTYREAVARAIEITGGGHSPTPSPRRGGSRRGKGAGTRAFRRTWE